MLVLSAMNWSRCLFRSVQDGSYALGKARLSEGFCRPVSYTFKVTVDCSIFDIYMVKSSDTSLTIAIRLLSGCGCIGLVI